MMLALLAVTLTVAALSVLPPPRSWARRARPSALVAIVGPAGELAGELRRAWRREVRSMQADLGAVVDRLGREAVPVGQLEAEGREPVWIRFMDGTVLVVASPSGPGLRIVATELASGRRVTVSRIYFTGNDTGGLIRFDTTSGPVPVRATTVVVPV